MFDIGFWELVLIGIMGLVILGPERLPVAIRTVRSWLAGARRFSDTVKSELTEELRVHELHENLKKAEQADLTNLSPEVAESLKTLKEAAASVNEPFKKVDRQGLDEMSSAPNTSAESRVILPEEEGKNSHIYEPIIEPDTKQSNPPNSEEQTKQPPSSNDKA